jgi:hypothetical protein
LGAVADAELAHDAADVGLGGERAEAQGLGGLGVVEAAGDQGEDLPLAFGEGGEGGGGEGARRGAAARSICWALAPPTGQPVPAPFAAVLAVALPRPVL